jgi:hypothetical protein
MPYLGSTRITGACHSCEPEPNCKGLHPNA